MFNSGSGFWFQSWALLRDLEVEKGATHGKHIIIVVVAAVIIFIIVVVADDDDDIDYYYYFH